MTKRLGCGFGARYFRERVLSRLSLCGEKPETGDTSPPSPLGKEGEAVQSPMREYLLRRDGLSPNQRSLADRYSFAKTHGSREALAETLRKGLALKLWGARRFQITHVITALRVSAKRHRERTEQIDQNIREAVFRLDTQEALPKERPLVRDDPAFRKTAEENQWKTRRQRGLPYKANIADFIQEVYGQWIALGMTRADLLAVDPGAYAALANYNRKHETALLASVEKSFGGNDE